MSGLIHGGDARRATCHPVSIDALEASVRAPHGVPVRLRGQGHVSARKRREILRTGLQPGQDHRWFQVGERHLIVFVRVKLQNGDAKLVQAVRDGL